MRRTALAVLAACTLALAGCSNSGSNAADKPTATVTATPSPTRHNLDGCKALLEKNYEDGNIHDASDDVECRNLSSSEYQEAVKDVLSGHVGSIMSKAADDVLYDGVWDSLSASTQESTCHMLAGQGAESVGASLAPMVSDGSVDTTAMAKYFYDEKC